MFFEIGGDNMDSKRVVIELLVRSCCLAFFIGRHCSPHNTEFSEFSTRHKWTGIQKLHIFRCAQGRVRVQRSCERRYVLYLLINSQKRDLVDIRRSERSTLMMKTLLPNILYIFLL